MSDTNQILAKFNVSTEDFEASVKKIRAVLSSLEADEKSRQAASSKASAETIASQKQQLATVASIKTQADALAAVEKKKTAEIRTQSEATKAQAAQQKALIDLQIASEKAKQIAAAATRIEQQKSIDLQLAASRTQIAEAQAVGRAKILAAQMEQLELRKTAELAKVASVQRLTQIREQTAALRLEALQNRGVLVGGRGKGEEKEGAGYLPNMIGGGMSAALGGGALGGVAKGMLIGGGSIIALEALSVGFEKLIEKIREFVTDSGQLQKVLGTFQKLSQAEGFNSGEYMDQLFNATHRLVPQTDMLRMANTLLQSGLKISREDVVKLTEATVGLARVNGKDADQAVSALTRTFLTGRGQALAYVTGMQRAQFQVRGVGEAAGAAGKAQANLNQVLKVITQRYAELGQPALTYSDRVRQLSVTTDELFEDMAQGVVKSGGFISFMDKLGVSIDTLANHESLATKFGSRLGDTFGALAMYVEDLAPLVEDVASDIGHLTNTLLSGVGLDKLFSKGTSGLSTFETHVLSINDAVATMVALLRDAILQVTLLAKDSLAIKGKDFFGWKTMGGTENTGGKKQSGLFDTLKKNQHDYDTQEQSMLSQSFASSNKSYQDAIQRTQIENLVRFMSQDATIQNYLKVARQKYGSKMPKTAQTNAVSTVLSQAQSSGQFAPGSINASMVQQALSNSAITVPNYGADPSLAFRTQSANMKAQQNNQKTQANAQLKQALADIAIQADANDKMYKAGIISEKQFYATKAALERSTYGAQISHAAAILAAQQQELQQELKLQKIAQSTANLKSQGYKTAASTSIVGAKAAEQKALDAIQQQKAVEDNQAQLKLIAMNLQARKNELAQELSAVQNNYKEQLISAKDYETAKVKLIMDGLAAEQSAANQTLALQKDSLANRLNTLKQYQQAVMTAQKAVQQIGQESAPNLAQDPSQLYSRQMATLQSRLKISSTNSAGAQSTVGSQQTIINQMKVATQDQIQQYQTLIATVQPLSTTWYEIYGNILKATQQLTLYNQQSDAASMALPSAGGTLSAISQQMSGVFGSHFAVGLESAISGVGQTYQALPQLKNALSRNTTTTYDPATQKLVDAASSSGSVLDKAANSTSQTFSTMSSSIKTASSSLAISLNKLTAVIDGLTGGKGSTTPALGQSSSADAVLSAIQTAGGPQSSAGQALSPTISSASILGNTTTGSSSGGNIFSGLMKSLKTLASPQGFQGLATLTTSLVGSFGGLFNAIEHSGSASAGALAGGMGGAGLGQSVGSSIKGLGSMGGPIGAAAGAGVGMILGMISGQKQETITAQLNALTLAMTKMTDAFSSGNASLADTITNIQALVAQAQVEMNASKKGASSFTTLINQYNLQIVQLQDQAKTTMAQLQQQLDILSSPVPYQSMISSIQSVVQQYSSFVGAAQNTAQLAQANQFLTGSLQTLAEGYATQLLSDEQNAVQQAIQLNDLMMQRNQMQYQYLKQTENIMGQGTITRNQTAAQSKFAQMYQAQVNYSNSMMTLNEQITVTQAQVTANQQIFKLAQNRQGLESQIASLQIESANIQMQSVTAMQQLLATLQSSGYSITNLSGVNTSDPNTLMTTLMALLVGQLGNSSPNNITNLINQIMGAVNGAGSASTSTSGPISLSGTAARTYAALAQRGLGGYSGTNLK